VRVFDLSTRSEIACPIGMDCEPGGPTTMHPGGGADAAAYGYLATAVDPCGAEE
jgi:hypothetical protein